MLADLARKITTTIAWMDSIRAYDAAAHRTRLRAPSIVQIQTIDRCNAACIMCPYSAVRKKAQTNVMEDGLYRRILDEVNRTVGVSEIVLMLQNEPLLNCKFCGRVRLARKILGKGVRIRTVTNGVPLTPAVVEELAASGIDLVSVSIDAAVEDTYKSIRKGLDFQRARENTISLINRLGPSRVEVRFLRQRENEREEADFASYWRRQGIRAVFTEPTNRAGFLQSYQRINNRQQKAWKKFAFPILNRLVPTCPLPFYSLCILWDGRVITCCHDWGPLDTVGDLSRQCLDEIWNGEALNHYRHLLWVHRHAENLVCANCSMLHGFWQL